MMLHSTNITEKDDVLSNLPIQDLREDGKKSLIFVVGDAQGRVDLLEQMIWKIESYKLAKNDKVVFLGNFMAGWGSETNDKVDARKVIRVLRMYQEYRKDNVVILPGACELMFVTGNKTWMKSPSGRSLYDSYRFQYQPPLIDPKNGHLNLKLIEEDKKWLKAHKPIYETDLYYFCTSGINPAIPLNRQNPRTTMFISSPDNLPKGKYPAKSNTITKRIIHGRMKTKQVSKPHVSLHSININTSPSETGILNCFVLNAKQSKVEEVLKAEEFSRAASSFNEQYKGS